MNEQILANIERQLGYITGKVEGIEEQMRQNNGTVASLKKQVARHEVALGKVGIVFTGVVVAMDFVAKAAIGLFKDKN